VESPATGISQQIAVFYGRARGFALMIRRRRGLRLETHPVSSQKEGTMTPATHTPPRSAVVVNGGTITSPRPVGPTVTAQPASSDRPFVRYVWAAARMCLGWTFLWAFIDKAFGLGHETPSAGAWINGGNPTKGFLSGSVGPFSGIYHSIAGADAVNVLFMVGLFGIGAALLLGIAMRPACIAGATLLLLMWSASLPPANNVFMDDHIIYALVLIGLSAVGAGKTLGLGARWERSAAVKRYAWLA
jgi:thiosulfate dehydrogenase [quinone] large subunit